ncbi:peptidyl-prolyl cis-trans isomerase [Iodidimonas gelatinilytica]|uniref:Peptidyl-prolyl cis-trans isomerase n=1 Tax=Iodidimonas gelatinilytica TaxID=1236966 RepID=A0A5A7MS98_9PROT|nr:peptidylprolyl isomerase [Iodidimonas gelatinilytica]GEQ98666.1 peptidyl-prolyl cis-trans isomerase [Iodidimonas gelatinilytica]GER00809.1 peptidyl-prolyl cis-trans isomerase [Iodidimonas gelatinilytica]
MSTASTGDTVKVHYTGTLDSGQQFDSSRDREPISFELGKRQVIVGFETAIEGMAPGETKQVKIPADEAYGQRRDDLVFAVPPDQFPAEMKAEEGMRVTGTTQQGQQVEMMIVKVTEETITLDANHPLAGHDLTFDLELVEIVG